MFKLSFLIYTRLDLKLSFNNSPGKPKLFLPVFKIVKTRFSVKQVVLKWEKLIGSPGSLKVEVMHSVYERLRTKGIGKTGVEWITSLPGIRLLRSDLLYLEI